MLTGTPLDLTPFGGLLAAIGWLYWLAALAIVLLALWWPKRWWVKLASALVVSGTVVYPVFVRPVEQRVDAARQQQDEFKARLADAIAQFEMRCKSAGEKIARTVDNVEGVVWMKWRDKPAYNADTDQFRRDDPYGRDCEGKFCIAQLLRVTSGAALNPEEGKLHSTGYRFVETVDPRDGQPYRYVGVIKLPAAWTPEKIEEHRKQTGAEVPAFSYRFHAEPHPIKAVTARYGVTWDDVSTPEDRKYWIAGGSTKIVDLTNNEVIAERIGYMMDRGLGSQAGFRSPWGFAPETACPPFPRSEGGGAFRSHRSRNFINRVLVPTTGD